MLSEKRSWFSCYNIKHRFLLTPETDPGIESMLMGGAETDESPAGQKTAGPDEYDLEEPAVGGANVEKQQQGKRPENMGKCV